MSLDYISLLKNFQPVIASYQDVSAIYTKLFTQGQLQKLANAITEIYDEEHVFTLTELQRYCQENNQKEDDFVAEQYELNSNIFRRNLTLIVHNLVEEIGKKVLDRFREDYSNGVSTEESSLKQSQHVEQPIQETVIEKPQYKSHMPEIQEEAENNSRLTPAQRLMKAEFEQTSATNKSFELNISDLMQKPAREDQQSEKAVNSQNNYENNQGRMYERQDSNQSNQSNSQQRIVPANVQRQEQYRNQPTHSNQTDPNQSGEFSQYNHETGTFRVSQEKFHSTPQQIRSPTNTVQHWSSPDRTGNFARRAPRSPPNQRNNRDISTEKIDRKSTSMMMNSYSRWSSSNGRPDPSILDSEFSYGQGQSFSKSPKGFHHKINNVPGPGEYEHEESVSMTRSKSPDHSFSKSSKGFHHKINNVPGPGEYEHEESVSMTRSKSPDHSFSKSPKKFHHKINNVPGPGEYEHEESVVMTRPKSPDHAFSKSPKTPSYFTQSKVPGAIYYPTKHFLSK